MNGIHDIVILAIVIVIIVIISYLVISGHLSQQVGGSRTTRLSGNAPFSLLGQNISDGVQGSYAGIINGPDPTKQQLSPTDLPLPTYYGHSIPLLPVTPGPFDTPPITPHHLNAKCSPECCPSPYSCDHGCLCVDQIGLRVKK